MKHGDFSPEEDEYIRSRVETIMGTNRRRWVVITAVRRQLFHFIQDDFILLYCQYYHSLVVLSPHDHLNYHHHHPHHQYDNIYYDHYHD